MYNVDLSFIRIPFSKLCNSTSDQWTTCNSTFLEICFISSSPVSRTKKSPAVQPVLFSSLMTHWTSGRRESLVSKLNGVADIWTTNTFEGEFSLHHSLIYILWAAVFPSLSLVIPQWHSSAMMTKRVRGFCCTDCFNWSKCISVSLLRRYINILFLTSDSSFASSFSLRNTPASGCRILFSVWSLSIRYLAVNTLKSTSSKASFNFAILW